MDLFFEKKDLLIIQMTHYLVEINKKKVPLISISKQIGIDKRALTSLIYQYNYLDLAQSGLHLKLDKEFLLCSRQPDFSDNFLHCLLFRKTLLFKLCHSFLTETFPGISKFSTENFISSSSMYRRINHLKIVLNEYNLTLNLADKNYLVGEEKQIRHFYFEVYYSAYGLENDYLKDSRTAQAELDSLIQDNLATSSFSFKQKTKLATYITLARIKQGKYLPLNLFDHDPSKQLAFSDDIKQYSHSLFTYYINDIHLFDVEKTFFSVYLSTFDIIVDSKTQFLTYLKMNHTLLDPHLARRWINELMTFFNIQLSAEHSFFLYVNLHYNFFRNHLLDGASFNNLDAKKNKRLLIKDDPYVYAKTTDFSAYLESKKGFPRSHCLFALYYLLLKEVLFLNKTVSIFVFSSSSTLQKKNIEHMIANLSPIKILFADDLTDSIDIIVADYSSPRLKLFLKENTITVITNTFPTKKNYESIKKAILKCHEKQLMKK